MVRTSDVAFHLLNALNHKFTVWCRIYLFLHFMSALVAGSHGGVLIKISLKYLT